MAKGTLKTEEEMKCGARLHLLKFIKYIVRTTLTMVEKIGKVNILVNIFLLSITWVEPQNILGR